MKTQLFGSLLLLFVFPFLSYSANPVYGVVSTPSDYPNQFDANEYSYIQESFPQLISIAGGNSVYIPYDLSDSQLIPILDAVDGVIFVGGGAQYWSESNTGVRQFTPFMLQIQKIIQYIQEQNNNGRYLPLVGICQGMEVTLMALTNNPYLLDTFVDSTDHGALNITEEGMQSRMFAAIQPKEADFLRANGTLFYNHQFGYNVSSLDNYPDLKANLTLTATAHDYNGKVYMAAVEANDWPMYIMMFHSEYILWEQQNGAFNHSAQDMQLVFSEATFFMEEAQNDFGNTAPKDVLDNWYFSQYEPLDIRAGHPKIYLAKGGNMVNTKKLTTAEAMSPEAFVTIQN